MLGMLETPGDLVRMTAAGREIVRASQAEKRLLFRRVVLTLGIFADLVRYLAADPEVARSGEEVRAFLAERLPGHGIPDLFKTIVAWGRYGQLFHYDGQADELSLHTGGDEDD
jgi:NitT/TauT family transport system ATP-binding protein